MTGRAPQKRAQASQKFLCVERFGQVVIGAGVKPGHFFAPGAAGGENQHRRGLAVAPPTLEHRDSIDLGQAKIQDHGVIGLGVAQEVSFLTVRRVVDGVVGVRQRLFQLARQVWIIFGEQDAHQLFGVLTWRSE